MKVLLLDIETAPNLAHVWGLFQQNVSVNQIMESAYVLCWAAKWVGGSELHFGSIQLGGRKRMLKPIFKLLDQADVVVHYNGSRFDIPHLNREFLEHGLGVPSPYKEVDLLKTVRNRFRFPSNKLEYVAKTLNLGQKYPHEGHELWINCMKKDPEAWKTMEKYNKHDVILLENLYGKLLPWIKNHPNHGAYSNGDHTCTNCGSDDLQRRGFVITSVYRYQRFQCKACGAWSRSSKAESKMPGVVRVC